MKIGLNGKVSRSSLYQLRSSLFNMEFSDQQAFSECSSQIENVLGWGPASAWSNNDFEKLRDLILDKTSVDLSVTTLKRFWGRVKNPHAPSTTTLNTLALFIGFADWRSFRQSLNVKQEIIVEEVIAKPKKEFVSQKKLWWLAAIPIIAGVYLLLSSSSKKKIEYDPNDFQFSTNKVKGEGVPNSVIFSYDASKAKTDSVYIVQTWDIRRKTLVSRSGTKHSAIYYYPGFFKTRLIVDGQVVRNHDLQITSDGWLALAEQEPIPLYFKKEEYLSDGGVKLEKTILEKYKLLNTSTAPRIRLFHQGDLGDLMDDNFVFNTTLRNNYDEGNNSCHKTQILIQCKDDIMIIPLMDKACVGDAEIYAAGKALQSRDSDLSGFGANLNEWVNLRIESKDKLISFFVNGKKAASFAFPNEPKGIVGVQYRFNGSCEVKDTWFENQSGKRILQ